MSHANHFKAPGLSLPRPLPPSDGTKDIEGLSTLLLPEGWADPKKLPHPSSSRGPLFPSDADALCIFDVNFDAKCEALLGRCLSASMAPNTIRDYFYAWRRWVDTCKAKGWCPCPAKANEFAKHLILIAQNTQKVGGITKAIAAVNYVHTLNQLPIPGYSPTISVVQEAIKRELTRPTVQKEPLLPWMVKAILRQYCTPTSSLWQWVIGINVMVAFALLDRYDDLSKLRLDPEYFELYETYAVFHVGKRKTDPLGKGQKVEISASGSSTCPIMLLHEYVRRVGPRGPLLKPLVPYSHQRQINLSSDTPMVYTTFLTAMRKALEECCGFPPELAKQFGTHSNRSGGATAMYRGGVDPNIPMNIAGVVGTQWRQRYDRPDLNTRLAASRTLGL